eukprot:5748283-Ditylum_brightwellii.AAC.1
MHAKEELYGDVLNQMNAMVASKIWVHSELMNLSQRSFRYPLQKKCIASENTTDYSAGNVNRRGSIVSKVVTVTVNIQNSFSGDSRAVHQNDKSDESGNKKINDYKEDKCDDNEIMLAEGWQQSRLDKHS